MMQELALPDVYRFLEPGPVVLLTTAQNGKMNVMAMLWHMMVEFVPPRLACVVSNGDYSFAAMRAVGECVIAIPSVESASEVVAVGNVSGRDVDKFSAFGLTPVAAGRVSAPLIEECFANFECRVVDDSLVEAYGIFVLEVLAAWVDPEKENPKTLHHHGYGKFVVDGRSIHLKSKMP
ncbi:flavin reductase family protein [Paludibacterium yongneupense]|uniref:flavin reductase family protein n=1 Tax=Paludibacterium yongneupense TaxID=400061 RepID=UPI0004098CFD|nr:flavin reductase family protein [Paludibacterium yongneupense]